ncbi:MAG: PLP-dependent aminotransferase family protein [Salinivirgaceae bacterium]|jgi:2-aminoadipate transaminase|nr:PLP-dependent aminotransferase family protein [Salinivirgaceae bacterium]
MITDLDNMFSNMVKRSKRSAIREILKLTKQPDIISFAGGLPAPESFPIDDLKEIVNRVLYEDGAASLQYDATEGLQELRETLIKKYQSERVNCTIENLIITTASQQGLDLLGKAFINLGDKVICGLPSYLGGLTAFMSYGAEMVGIPLDKFGMRSDILEEALINLKSKGEKPKFIYIIPDFQNPAGITMPKMRRLEIIQIAEKYNVLIVEDSPYRELRFEGDHQPMMYQLNDTGNVITLGTFSKIVAPGFRIGWVLGHPKILDKLVILKQSSDLCTATFVQKIAAKYMQSMQFEKNLKQTIKLYKERRNVMLQGFKKYMPPEVSWTEPEGGLFLFMTLPDYINADELLLKAIEKKVAFVIGNVFFADRTGLNTLRLNFSFVNNQKNREGVKRLAEVIKEEIAIYKQSKTIVNLLKPKDSKSLTSI